jgi:ABC-type multidrug transport system ATPase subunit
MMPVISLTGVGRRYGSHDALADVTADLGTPSITGLLGHHPPPGCVTAVGQGR